MGEMLDVGLACPLPSSATPNKTVGQGDKASPNTEGPRRGPDPALGPHLGPRCSWHATRCLGVVLTKLAKEATAPNRAWQAAGETAGITLPVVLSSSRGPECQEGAGSSGQYGFLGGGSQDAEWATLV